MEDVDDNITSTETTVPAVEPKQARGKKSKPLIIRLEPKDYRNSPVLPEACQGRQLDVLIVDILFIHCIRSL